MFSKLRDRFLQWIVYEKPNTDVPLCDFERIRYEVRPCDVILIEGRSRVSEAIKQITQSSWSHACLYIGRLHDVDDLALREKLSEHFKGDPEVQLVIEGFLGKGTIASPLDNYQTDHIRICRPRGLSRKDAQQVIAHAIHQLGSEYDVRQIFDLARFLVPWSILSRRWRSSLFEFRTGASTRTVCSTMIAEAFGAIDFPILPVVKQHEETGIELFVRNPRIFTPRDFDYSPYFEIIKYPFISFAEGPYRSLPWNRQGLYSQDGENIIDPNKEKIQTKTRVKLQFKKTPPLETKEKKEKKENNENIENIKSEASPAQTPSSEVTSQPVPIDRSI